MSLMSDFAHLRWKYDKLENEFGVLKIKYEQLRELKRSLMERNRELLVELDKLIREFEKRSQHGSGS